MVTEDFKNEPTEYMEVDISSLKTKMKAFCREYVIDNNGFRAAKAVGYHEKHSWRLLKDERIIAYIAWLTEDMRTEQIASAQEIMTRLTKVMRGESEEEVVTPKGAIVLKGTDVRDRIKAAELLGKRYAMWTDKVETKSETHIVVDISDEDDDDDEYI